MIFKQKLNEKKKKKKRKKKEKKKNLTIIEKSIINNIFVNYPDFGKNPVINKTYCEYEILI
jgi:hypothetical protein